MQRWIMAAILALALGVSGCSGGSAGEADPSKPVTLTYGVWGTEPAMKQIAEEFTKQNPNVTIKVQLTPNKEYWTKLQTAVQGGSAPDVFWMNGPRFQLYASEGAIAPLPDGAFDPNSYPKSLVDLYTYDGKRYSAPKDFDTMALYYNKQLFDEAGVAYPSKDMTWAEVRDLAKRVTNKDQGTYGLGAPAYNQEDYYNTMVQAGGFIINQDKTKLGFTDPKSKEGIKFWLDVIADGSSPTGQQMTDTPAEDLFRSGKIAMLYGGSYSIVDYRDSDAVKGKLGVVPLPKGATGNQSIIHGLGNVVNAKSPNRAWAEKFAAFASGERAAQIMAETGSVIPAHNGTQEAWLKAYPEMDMQVFLDAVPTSVPYPISKNTAGWAAKETELMPQIWTGRLGLDEGLTKLQNEAQAALDQERG